MEQYWTVLTSFTNFLFRSFSFLLDFLISNPLTFTALALGLITLAFDILFRFGKDEED